MTIDMSKTESNRRVAWMGEGKIVVSDVLESGEKAGRTRKSRESKIKKWTSQIEKEKKICSDIEERLRKKELGAQAAADRQALAEEEEEDQLQIEDDRPAMREDSANGDEEQ